MAALVGLAVVSVWTGQARADFAFGTPRNLGPQINSSDCASTIRPSRPTAWSCTFSPAGPAAYGDADLYVAKRATTQDEWYGAQNLGPARQHAPQRSPGRASRPTV